MMLRVLGAAAFAFAVMGNVLGSWGALTWSVVLSVLVACGARLAAHARAERVEAPA